MTVGFVILIIIIVLAVFFLIIGLYDGNRYVVSNEDFYLKGLKKNFRFVMFSDLHNKVYGNNNERLIRDIKAANPDFIIIAGDLITSHLNENYEPGISLVKELSKDFKIYYGMGNHESRIKEDIDILPGKYDELLAGVKDNAVMLANESVYLEEYNLKITGLEIPKIYFERFNKRKLPIAYVDNAIGKIDTTSANILIAHNPEFFDTYAKWGANLVLSGHVHGGIMRLPILGGVISPSFRLFPKYDSGIFKKDDSVMLLSRGIGAHTLPFRFFNPAEIHVVNCLKES